jgi:hypothetical protein
VIDDVFQDNQTTHPENVRNAMPPFAVQRSQRTAMDVESRYLLSQLLGDDENRHLRPPVKHVAQAPNPALGEQKRPRPKAGIDGAPNDLLTLSDKEPMLCLEVSTK